MKRYKIYYCGQALDIISARSKPEALRKIFKESNWGVHEK